jgi:hypothetical protein
MMDMSPATYHIIHSNAMNTSIVSAIISHLFAMIIPLSITLLLILPTRSTVIYSTT